MFGTAATLHNKEVFFFQNHLSFQKLLTQAYNNAQIIHRSIKTEKNYVLSTGIKL